MGIGRRRGSLGIWARSRALRNTAVEEFEFSGRTPMIVIDIAAFELGYAERLVVAVLLDRHARKRTPSYSL